MEKGKEIKLGKKWKESERKMKEKLFDFLAAYFEAATIRKEVIREIAEKLGLKNKTVADIVSHCRAKNFFPEKFILIPKKGIKVVIAVSSEMAMVFAVEEEKIMSSPLQYLGEDEDIKNINIKISPSEGGEIQITIGERIFSLS